MSEKVSKEKAIKIAKHYALIAGKENHHDYLLGDIITVLRKQNFKVDRG